MALNCPCPLNTSLTAITKETCATDVGQIQRFAIQRLGQTFSGADDANDITKLSAWTTRISATDATKIVVSPLIGGDPIIDSGDAITVGGGDNSTLNGQEEVTGRNSAIFTCLFRSMTANNEREMKNLLCEGRVRVFFFNQHQNIICMDVTVGSDPKQGFVASNLFLSDRNINGFGAKDTHDFRLSLDPNWSDNLVIIDPEFNPLTAI